MNTGTADTRFESFLKVAMQRLWLLTTIDIIQDALWLLVGLALVMAGIHFLIAAVPASTLWFPIYLVTAVTFIRVVLRRPKMALAAVDIDRRFGAGALISTACECLRTPADQRRPAASLVIAQANEAASQWRQEVAETLVAKPRVSIAAALVPLFVAIFLLLQPGSTTDQRTGDIQVPIYDKAVAANETESPADPVSRLRSELSALPARSAEVADDPVTGNPVQPFDKNNAGSSAHVEQEQLPLAVLTAAKSDHDSGAAGDAVPNNQTQTQTPTSKRQMQSTVFQHRLTGEAQAVQSVSNAAYDVVSINARGSTVSALPAAPPEKARDRSTLNTAQAAYVSRYLRATGENNE